MSEKRTLMIVFEETGANGGMSFNVYLAGNVERLNHLEECDLSPAEFWGSRIFELCIQTLKDSGSVSIDYANKRGNLI